ncbi:MAG: hemolysin family protein [Planctomycetota bacterium]
MSQTLIMLAAADLGSAAIALNLALLLALVICSGLLSGSETVLFSLTRLQLEHAAASSNPLRRLASRLMQYPKYTLMTILVGNTAVNILIFAISYIFFRRLADQAGAWITPLAGIGSVLLVVVGGEVVPKVLAVRFANRLAPLSAVLVRILSYVAGPLGWLIDFLIAEPFVRVVLGRSSKRITNAPDLSTAELKALLQLSHRRGTINRIEDEFLREIVDLGSTRVREVMVPRVEITAYDINDPPVGLRELIRSTRLKKIPVYDQSMDNIVGLVYAKMLFLNPDRPLAEVIMPVHFVPEVATCEQLLHHFRQTRTQLAIAVDEYGGMAGLVTLEDVLEEIVGELSDPEEEPTESEIHQLSDNEYDISGLLDVRYWAETFGLEPLAERVATVGGLVTARLGRPAQVGDLVRLGNIELTVRSLHRRRIERLRLRLLDTAPGGTAP